MKNKIAIGLGILLLFLAGFVKYNMALNVIGGSFLALGVFGLFGLSVGVDYTESHYRIYTRILFWKTGPWKSIGGVRKIYIRHHLKPDIMSQNHNEGVTEYQVYFVRKSGNYKIFSSTVLKEARDKAGELAQKYNLAIKEKAPKRDYSIKESSSIPVQ